MSTLTPEWERLYVHGPTAGWSGVCEVNDERTEFIHHLHWPRRNSVRMWGKLTQFDELIRDGSWVPYRPVPDHLRVSEGL